MARLRAWVQASRPHAQALVAVPLIYGQALAYRRTGEFSWKLCVLVHLFGFFDLLLVVFTNDLADTASDARNTTFNRWSGGSRVVPEGKLTMLDLARAATLAFIGMSAVAADLVFRERRAWMVVMAAMGAHMLWIYCFPPFRLSYRGGGGFVQGAWLGLLLPVCAYYAQAGTLVGLSPATFLPAFVLGYASHVTLALADAPSDAATDKRSLAVRRGEPAARRVALMAIALSALATPLAAPGVPVLGWVLVTAVAAVTLRPNVSLLATADSTDRVRCARFVTTNLRAIAALVIGWSVVLVASKVGAPRILW